jgi:hemoglobin
MNDIRNDEDLKKLVDTFYDKVKHDDRLGYIFNDVAKVNWDTHLPKMVSFWSNLLFDTGRYKGRPFRQHAPLPIIKTDFLRWYSLFVETVDALFTGEKADFIKDMAGRIASSFSLRMEMGGKYNRQENSLGPFS